MTIAHAPAPASAASRHKQAVHLAEQLFQKGPDWVAFYREVLSLEGFVHKMFPNPDDLAEFERSAEFEQILAMLARLREKKTPSDDSEPTRVITVRLPKSMHEALKTEASLRDTSVNQLCISKLLWVIDNRFIPSEAKSRKSSSDGRPSPTDGRPSPATGDSSGG